MLNAVIHFLLGCVAGLGVLMIATVLYTAIASDPFSGLFWRWIDYRCEKRKQRLWKRDVLRRYLLEQNKRRGMRW